MAADHPFDIRMSGDHGAQPLDARAQADAVHVSDQCCERGVMHRDDHGLGRAGRELGIEPVQTRVAERAVARAVNHGVERQQMQWTDPGRVLDRERAIGGPDALGQPRMVGKGSAQLVAVVVVAGHQVDRHRQRREKPPQALILGRATEVHQIAGNDHRIRRLT